VGAGKGLLTGVDALVADQVMSRAKPLAAVSAAEGPLAPVVPLMLGQRSLALQALTALGAHGRGVLHQTRGLQGVEEGIFRRDPLAPSWLGHVQEQGSGC